MPFIKKKVLQRIKHMDSARASCYGDSGGNFALKRKTVSA
jgi:hypothetical protein